MEKGGMMGVGPQPPEVDLMEAVVVADGTVILEGKNSNDGTPVKLIRFGDASYFSAGEKFKVTFDPLPKSKSA
jgi:hypothetical protein